MSEISGYIVHIKKVLRLNVSDVARMAGVSRQTVYDWQAGRFEISPNYASYMRRLDHAADMFEEAGIETRRYLLRRPIENGRSFLDIAADGDPGRAAYILLGILEKEDMERKRLHDRLASRGPADFTDV